MNAIPLPKRRSNLAGRAAKWLALALGVALIAVYTFYHVKDTLAGPRLTLTSPAPDETVNINPVTVSGQAKRISLLFVNERPVLITEEGRFAEKLLLAPGYNIIKLRASDRFGRTEEQEIALVYSPEPDPTRHQISLRDGQKN
jgi:hypothetical protein